MTPIPAQPTGTLNRNKQLASLLVSTGEKIVATHSEAEAFVQLKKSHKRIWPSKDLKTFHWVFMPPEPSVAVYSGSADSVPNAELAIIEAAQVHLTSHETE